MGKLYDGLQKQLQTEFKKDAEDCLKIYEKLKELNAGSVWSSQWQPLTTIAGWMGEKPNVKMAIKPTAMGYVFLKGIGENKEQKGIVRRIPVQMTIMSHLSDAQQFLFAFSQGCLSYANDKINFSKQLLLTYPDTSVEVSEEELNELWRKTIHD